MYPLPQTKNKKQSKTNKKQKQKQKYKSIIQKLKQRRRKQYNAVSIVWLCYRSIRFEQELITISGAHEFTPAFSVVRVDLSLSSV
jgi:hypothetical protein